MRISDWSSDVCSSDLESVHWVGYFGYASRGDLPARLDPDDPMPTAVWMRTQNVETFIHPEPSPTRAPDSPAPPTAGDEAVPDDYAAAFARVKEHLHAGNSYEVNLTYRPGLAPAPDPVRSYLRTRAIPPAPFPGSLHPPGNWVLRPTPYHHD